MKKKYYWKVVRILDTGIYGSCIIKSGKYSLYYNIGIPTKSAMDENGIFVFNTRESARRFKNDIFDPDCMYVKIFKCEVHGKEVNNPTYYSTLALIDGCKRDFGISFPRGTKSFPSITLIK